MEGSGFGARGSLVLGVLLVVMAVYEAVSAVLRAVSGNWIGAVWATVLCVIFAVSAPGNLRRWRRLRQDGQPGEGG